MNVKTAVGDVLLELARIGRAASEVAAVQTAIARQRAEAGPPFVVDDIVRITAGKLGRAVFLGHPWQTQAGPQVDQHILEGSHVAVWRDNRMAYRIRRTIRFR